MNDNYTIAETYTLPSLGKVYNKQVNPEITLKSMTTEQEMRRLSPSDFMYKNMCDMIDSCMANDPGISSYSMILGDYLYLLYKLRTVTYSSNYKLSSPCPFCGNVNEDVINLDELKVNTFTEDLKKYLEFDLPKSGKHIKLKMQTPRMIDNVLKKVKEFKKTAEDKSFDPTLIYTLMESIDLVDGEVLQDFKLENFVKNLPMADTNMIIAYADKLNAAIGLDVSLQSKCDLCGLEYKTVLKMDSEFFRPALDI